MEPDRNFYIFREGRRRVSALTLVARLDRVLRIAQDENGWIEALLRSGELECAMADSGSTNTHVIGEVTDHCADALVCSDYRPQLLADLLPRGISGELTVTTPEGFAYYALNPLQYALVVDGFSKLQSVLVVGIRSIGTTLSAIVCAALRKRNVVAERVTVRPEGHAYDRALHLSDGVRESLRVATEQKSVILVLDEGPGLSGSSFLATAEAIENEGVAAEKIVLVPSHSPDIGKLCAPNAAERWRRYECCPVPQMPRPSGDRWIGAGEWRREFSGPEENWRASWTTLERAKFLSADGNTFWKFEGLGHYGSDAIAQARRLAEEGFSPSRREVRAGFIGYERLRGRPASKQDLDPQRLETIAEYCAFRAKHFVAEVSTEQCEQLRIMATVNFEREFGSPLPARFSKLVVVAPTHCDGRMLPQEWLILNDGRFVKTDATAHGDDHFFPGPCDIAWDIAGAVIEWQMDGPTRAQFIGAYTSLSGDNISARFDTYRAAYAIFRYAWSRMAAAGMEGTADHERLIRDYRRYRTYVEELVFSGEPEGEEETPSWNRV